jgi:hypothetical protein
MICTNIIGKEHKIYREINWNYRKGKLLSVLYVLATYKDVFFLCKDASTIQKQRIKDSKKPSPLSPSFY